MKLRNKKTGEIGEIGYIGSTDGSIAVNPINRVACETIASYNSLAGLNEEWEDYKSDKERWYINENGGVLKYIPVDPNGEDLTYMGYQKEIGNYFETKEEAEKAVEKLKAWKRLKDNGYEFNGIGVNYDGYKIYLKCDIMKKEHYTPAQDHKDLDLLFGGEE